MDYRYTITRTPKTEQIASTLKAMVAPLAVSKTKWTITLKTDSLMTYDVIRAMLDEVQK